MSARPDHGWLAQWDYAHRGLHGPGVPENSLAAAAAAMAAGLGIECDIQRSRDDHPMVFHDWELTRLTGRDGLTEELDAETLEALTLMGSDQTPVRLERLLEQVAARVPLLIEVKSQPGYDVEVTCVEVSRLLAGYTGLHAVMSFDPRVCAWFAAHDCARVRGLVGTDSYINGFEGVWRDPDTIERADPDFLAVDLRDLDRPESASWREAGKPLLCWTVRARADRTQALARADALIAEGDAIA
jgi:glycerophosphoryl diester phosphodiesterase